MLTEPVISLLSLSFQSIFISHRTYAWSPGDCGEGSLPPTFWICTLFQVVHIWFFVLFIQAGEIWSWIFWDSSLPPRRTCLPWDLSSEVVHLRKPYSSSCRLLSWDLSPRQEASIVHSEWVLRFLSLPSCWVSDDPFFCAFVGELSEILKTSIISLTIHKSASPDALCSWLFLLCKFPISSLLIAQNKSAVGLFFSLPSVLHWWRNCSLQNQRDSARFVRQTTLGPIFHRYCTIPG